MKLSAGSVRAAIARHVSADLAAALKLPAELEDADMGPLLALALGGEADAPLAVAVFISPDSTVITLGPDDVRSHPVFRDWTALTLAGALGLAFMAGSRLYYAAAGSPEFGNITLSNFGGGHAQLRFPLANGSIEATVGQLPPDQWSRPGPGRARRQNGRQRAWRRHRAAGNRDSSLRRSPLCLVNKC